MSSFICTRRHFDSIANGIMCLHLQPDFYFPKNLLAFAPELGLCNNNGYAKKRINKLVSMLMDLQVTSVCCQYKNDKRPVEDDIRINKAGLRHASLDPLSLQPIPLYKALGCALYQIETEQLEKRRPLSQQEQQCLVFFKELNSKLAEYTVHRLKEYDAALWAIE